MQLLQKNDPKRKWRSFKRHAILIVKTLAIASAITGIWYELWIHGCHFADDDKDIIIGAIITSFGVTYGISLSWIFSRLGDTYTKIVQAVLEKDVHTLMLWRDERVLIAVHLSVGIPSFFLLGWIGAVSYRHVLTGAISVFTISVMLVFFWFLARMIERPLQNEWFKERVDPKVFTTNVDEYFKLGEKDPKRHPHD